MICFYLLAWMFLPSSGHAQSGPEPAGLGANNGTPSSGARGQTDLIQLGVSVFNYAPFSTSIVEKAEGEASRVLRDVGVEVIWDNCLQGTLRGASIDHCAEVSFPFHFDLRIIRSSRNLKASTVGISFFADDGKGCCADVFYQPIEQLQNETDVSPSVVLGYAMAHELGHLLLGINSHTPNGLMRAHWTREDLDNASRANLWFSYEQSIRIRSRLTPRRESQGVQTIEMPAALVGTKRFK